VNLANGKRLMKKDFCYRVDLFDRLDASRENPIIPRTNIVILIID
jgi:hypothetical protein